MLNKLILFFSCAVILSLIIFYCNDPLPPPIFETKVSISIGPPANGAYPGRRINEQIAFIINITNRADIDSVVLNRGNAVKETFINPNSNIPTYVLYTSVGIKKINVTAFTKSNKLMSIDTTLEIGSVPVINPKLLIASGNAVLNQPFSLQTEALGYGSLIYEWYKDNILLEKSGVKTLKIAQLAISNKGSYRCIVSSLWGADTSAEYILDPTDLIDKPVIVVQPQNIATTVGNLARFSVTATGKDLKYQWQRDQKDIPNALLSVFDIPLTALTDNNAKFRCKVSNSFGDVISNEATLSVVDKEIPAKIITHPQDVEVFKGGTARFSVITEGTNLTYKWKKNSEVIINETLPLLELKSVSSADNGSSIICYIENSLGTISSNPAKLTVKDSDIPLIKGHPQNVEVVEGDSASFSIVAIGLNLNYQWQKNGSKIPGETKSRYTISSVVKSDNGAKIKCEVSNTLGAVTSNEAILTIVEKVTPPKITKQPDNKSGKKGETVTFSLEATGTSITYQWQKNGSDILGATNPSYTTPALEKSDNYTTYKCIVKNSTGTEESKTVSLEVFYAEITQQPQSPGNIIIGKSFSLYITAEGNPDPLYEWKRNGTNVGSSSTLSIPSAKESDKGWYVCRVYNEKGCEVTSTSVNVNVTEDPPVITEQPKEKEVFLSSINATSETVFSIKATGTNLKYQWNGIQGIGANTPDFRVTLDKNTPDSKISCTVSNSIASVTSDSISLIVNWKPQMPSITCSPPADDSGELFIEPGKSFTLTAKIGDLGKPRGEGSWYYGSKSLNIPGATYSINSATEKDSQKYWYCVLFQNKFLFRSNFVNIHVKKPNRTLQTKSQDIYLNKPGEYNGNLH